MIRDRSRASRWLLWLGLMWALPTVTSSQASAALTVDDATLVRSVFDAYKEALLAGDGQAAVSLVDQSTLDYWAVLRDLAVSGEEAEVRDRSFIDRLLIVSIRHEIPQAELKTMELEDLIEVAFRSGWIAPASIEQLVMGEVEVDGDQASAEAMTRASAADPTTDSVVDTLRYQFVREDGQWKFRFATLISGLNRVIAELTTALGTEEDDLIFVLVESFSGRKVLPEVWQTPDETSKAPPP